MPDFNIVKLPESIGRGIDKVAKFFTGKGNVEIDRHKCLTEAQTELDAAAIRDGKAVYRDGNFMQLFQPILEEANQGFDDAEKNNMVECLYIGLDQVQHLKDEDVAPEPLDADWMLRWRNVAKLTSHKELQDLVGKILAEEVKNSNCISYRALDVIKNLRRTDLQMFMDVCQYVFAGKSLLRSDGIHHGIQGFSFPDIPYQSLLHLDDVGLLRASEILHKTQRRPYDGQLFPPVFLFNSFAVFFPDIDEVSIPCYPLTAAGRELYPLLNLEAPSTEIIQWIAEHLANDRFPDASKKRRVIVRPANRNDVNLDEQILEINPSSPTGDAG